MSRIPSFKDLEVWKKSMDLVDRIYELTQTYPLDERFGLVAETRKTVRSIPYNVAEGKKRVSSKEFRHFVSIASGSLGELHTQVLMASRRKYLSPETLPRLESQIEEIGKMLYSLERALSPSAGA
jgi:four helix bundle protein